MSAKKDSRPRRAIARALSTTVSVPTDDPFIASADDSMLLALAAPVVRGPSPAVKNALLARIRSTKATAATAGWRFEKLTAAAGWVKLPFPGLRMREVTLDIARDTALLFVEMTPGTI